MYTLKQGELLVKEARKSIEKFLSKEEVHKIDSSKPWLNEKRGIFVTLHTFPEKKLRGCIGFTSPVPLQDVVPKAAIAAATQDPRFLPLNSFELEKTSLEVSILSEFKPIKAKGEGVLEKIVPFEDGIILKKDGANALFLPQVWDIIPEKEKFLENLCFKAGLPSNSWKEKDAKLFKFKVQAFEEAAPSKDVVEKAIAKKQKIQPVSLF